MLIKTCEFVSPLHPDKLCDFIADAILDAYMVVDKNAKVAVEVMGGHKSISVSGEVRSKAKVDITQVVQRIMDENYHVHLHVVEQSPFIAKGVDWGGAGDQGIMIGHAVSETRNFMSVEYNLARNLCREIYKRYPYDGKVQVTIEQSSAFAKSSSARQSDAAILSLGQIVSLPPASARHERAGRSQIRIRAVVASFQNTKTLALLKLVKKLIKAEEYFINPAGEWTIGGFDADSGLTGRKIIIDNYGPEYSVGGGSFSGKDYTKVDRSGAYMARKIAVDLLKRYKADETSVKLAYVIGKPKPVMSVALVDGKEISVPKKYNLTPRGIRNFLKLNQPIYKKTALWGHFGNNFAWDK